MFETELRINLHKTAQGLEKDAKRLHACQVHPDLSNRARYPLPEDDAEDVRRNLRLAAEHLEAAAARLERAQRKILLTEAKGATSA